MRTKTCSRCQRELPIHEFARNRVSRDGLSSHCRMCKYEVTKEWETRSPDYRQQALEERKMYSGSKHFDPMRYSQSVCAHVAQYVERAVERFEKHTGMEAPPHMTALRQVAESFVEQHPPEEIRRGEKECADCGVIFSMRITGSGRKSNSILCGPCIQERKRASWRAKNKRRSIRSAALESSSAVRREDRAGLTKPST